MNLLQELIMPEKIYPSTTNYNKRSFPQRVFRWIIVVLFKLLVRMDVEGLENFPQSGPLLLVSNHLHLLDAPIALIFIPRRITVFVKSKYKRPPFNWLMACMGDVIYISKADHRALEEGINALQSGRVLALAPEGTRSLTGGLGKGQAGVALLAKKAHAPILPIAAHGQEQAMNYWKRFRRVPVHIEVGQLIELPPGKASKEQLETYTEQIMIAIARLLPTEYRGVYAELASANENLHIDA
jgi:1-acyl-sn-glycerol-3-phosphate acyltransferase